jgi:hypothetical protein
MGNLILAQRKELRYGNNLIDKDLNKIKNGQSAAKIPIVWNKVHRLDGTGGDIICLNMYPP